MLRATPLSRMLRVSKVVATVPSKGSPENPQLNLPKHRYSVTNEDYRMPHLTYTPKDIEVIEQTHRTPLNLRDKIALKVLRFTRKSFDWVTGYNETGGMNKRKWVNRALFLETVAGVPGMIGGLVRHLASLRKMKHDYGWIHHLLEEAENERMHLFFFLKERDPGFVFRSAVTLTQFVFVPFYLLVYAISPKFLHRFVGYLEEEATHTYTVMIKDIDRPNGPLEEWRTKKVDREFTRYWGCPENASIRDIILCIRADEIGHREYNHLFADIHGRNESKMITERLVFEEPKK